MNKLKCILVYLAFTLVSLSCHPAYAEQAPATSAGQTLDDVTDDNIRTITVRILEIIRDSCDKNGRVPFLKKEVEVDAERGEIQEGTPPPFVNYYCFTSKGGETL